MAKDSKAATLKRLNRIEGQVRGLARMVEDERYCIDIVTQLGAVRVDRHPADGIDDAAGGRLMMMVMICRLGHVLPPIPPGGI